MCNCYFDKPGHGNSLPWHIVSPLERSDPGCAPFHPGCLSIHFELRMKIIINDTSHSACRSTFGKLSWFLKNLKMFLACLQNVWVCHGHISIGNSEHGGWTAAKKYCAI